MSIKQFQVLVLGHPGLWIEEKSFMNIHTYKWCPYTKTVLCWRHLPIAQIHLKHRKQLCDDFPPIFELLSQLNLIMETKAF